MIVIPAIATRIAAMWSCKSHSTYLVLNNMSKSLGRCTCRFETRLLTIELAISSRLSERMATLFFPFGKFPMWYLILASLSADQCTHPGNCWQRLRHFQGNPSRIPVVQSLRSLELEDETNNHLNVAPTNCCQDHLCF